MVVRFIANSKTMPFSLRLYVASYRNEGAIRKFFSEPNRAEPPIYVPIYVTKLR